MEHYAYLKALHIIFVVCWFAGLFYIVRLFVYAAEAELKDEPHRSILAEQYKIMTHRLWFIITWPSAVLATIFGVLMLIYNPYLLEQRWMHVKLALVFLLWLYHFRAHGFVAEVAQNRLSKSGSYFRIWNEGATLLLFSVVFLAVLKNSIDWIWGTFGIVIFAVLLMFGYKFYKRIRQKNGS